MINLEKYPIDFESIVKGDVFNTEQLEKIVAEKVGTDAFDLKVLNLRDLIMKATNFIVKVERGTLRVLDDEEASPYADKNFYKNLRGMRSWHRRMINSVDIHNLPPSMRDEHQRKIISQSRYISALRQAKTIIVPVDNKQLDKAK